METVINELKQWITLYGLKIFSSILVLLFGIWFSKRFSKFLEKLFLRHDFDKTIGVFLVSIIYYSLLVISVIIALTTAGVQTTSIVAIIAAAGLAIGLSLQNSLANFASGIIIILFRPFSVGDFIEGGGVAGSVDRIGIFGTTLNTYDNLRIFVPNSKITGDIIKNYAANERRMLDLVISVSYSDDILKVKEILYNILNNDSKVYKDPPPFVMVKEFADSSINFGVRPWVHKSNYWAFIWDFNEKVKLTFDKEGITIPFPQRDIYIKEGLQNKI